VRAPTPSRAAPPDSRTRNSRLSARAESPFRLLPSDIFTSVLVCVPATRPLSDRAMGSSLYCSGRCGAACGPGHSAWGRGAPGFSAERYERAPPSK
jgi:hypothetical protein